MKLKFLVVASALGFAANAHAIYIDDFQGLTFTIDQTDMDTLSLNIKGTPSGDWTGVQYLAAFDLKDLGLDFTATTAIANGPGAVNLAGLNSQLSAANLDCTQATGQKGTVCFDVSPDVALGALPIDFTYIIDFSSPLNIGLNGPHLQIAFSNVQDGAKVGSLYSQNIPVKVAEPRPSLLFLLGLALLGMSQYARKAARLEGFGRRATA